MGNEDSIALEMIHSEYNRSQEPYTDNKIISSK